MSSPENSAFEVQPPAPELQAAAPPPAARYGEDPSWSGWAVLALVAIGIASFFFFSGVVIIGAQRLFYPGVALIEVVQQHVMLALLAQALSYLLVFVFMVVFTRDSGQGFWKSLPWNWPANWWAYLAGGVGLAITLAVLEQVLHLPMPKEAPIDRFFRTTRDVWILVVFGTLVAPLMEELFFRGFFYPVLVRRLGVPVGIVITSLGFGLVHASQFGFAWAPVLVIFVVGVVLTSIRAVTKSVAPGVLTHIAYNSTLFSAMFAVTHGFHQLDKVS